jgi:hypothetical protein
MRAMAGIVLASALTIGACGGGSGSPGFFGDGGASSSGTASPSNPTDGGASRPSGTRRDPIDPSTKCYFTGDIASERINDVIRASGCGVGTVTDGVVVFHVSELNLVAGRNVQVEFKVEGVLKPGRVGPLLVERVRLTLSEGQTKYIWESGTCSVEITANTATDGTGGPFEDADLDGGAFDMKVSGRGSCPDPLQPSEAATQVASITPFEFMFQAKRR